VTNLVLEPDLREALTEVARARRVLEMEGHGEMTLRHLSPRDPSGRGFWMKRNQIGLGEVLKPDDFVLVDGDGEQIARRGGRHSEWPTHSEILHVRPDVPVIAHTHPFHACVFSGSLDPLQPFTVGADYFVEVPRHVDNVALITTKEEGASLALTPGKGFAVLMGHHGVTFRGTTVVHSACVGIFLEKACKATYSALTPDFVPRCPALRHTLRETGKS
jgi:L-fuculose-phosphate aldolase